MLVCSIFRFECEHLIMGARHWVTPRLCVWLLIVTKELHTLCKQSTLLTWKKQEHLIKALALWLHKMTITRCVFVHFPFIPLDISLSSGGLILVNFDLFLSQVTCTVWEISLGPQLNSLWTTIIDIKNCGKCMYSHLRYFSLVHFAERTSFDYFI